VDKGRAPLAEDVAPVAPFFAAPCFPAKCDALIGKWTANGVVRWYYLRYAVGLLEPKNSLWPPRRTVGRSCISAVRFLISSWLQVVLCFGTTDPGTGSAPTKLCQAPQQVRHLTGKYVLFKTFWQWVYYTACSLLVISKNSCGTLHCQICFNSIIFPYKIAYPRTTRNISRSFI